MLFFYQSNQLDVLAGLIGPLMRREPLANPFICEQVLVQSPGMAQWLKLELAKQLDIAANIEFPLPASFIWRMFHIVLSDVPEQSPFNKQSMAWRLMRLLPKQQADPDFSPLFAYLDEQGEVSERKRWQLCQKIADLFDQYLVYRPHWTTSWEAGDDRPEISASEPWQPKLWRLLVDDTVTYMENPYHRGNLFDHFIERLTLGSPVEGLPPRVFIFGLSALPPAYLKALEALGQHIEIHLFFSNPSCEYWGDVRDQPQLVGNPLLASMGKLGRDYIELLAETQKQELDLDLFIEPEGEQMLPTVQRDILHLYNPIDPNAWESSDHKRLMASHDQSICFHICHNARRELEVLHDQLLAMFEADPQLSPRDVIVMVPDINLYSSAINAVFGSVGSQCYIPYAISDRSVREESPLLQSFIELLALPMSRSSASGILTLLEVPAIGRRFEIDPTDLPMLRQWVIESGVRWGLDQDDLTRWSSPEMSEKNSWIFGLKRMLLGYAMDDDTLIDGVLAYPESQGIAGELVGQLADFIDALIALRNDWLTPADSETWQERLWWLMRQFYLFDEKDALDEQQLIAVIEQFYTTTESCQYTAPIEAMIIHDYVRNQLNSTSGSQRFLAGPVNFCTLLPMRSIPFKVICLLGMNDADYPRTVTQIGFDLMAKNPMQRGDRSRREDDRYLFLEALLAAQQRLYISYVGRSVYDNSLLEPSVLVSELRDYLGQGFYLDGDEQLSSDESAERLLSALTLEHPLAPFSPEYFNTKPPFFSYHSRWLEAARVLQSSAMTPQEEPQPARLSQGLAVDESLAYQDLRQFVRGPSEWLYKRRLNVHYPNLEDELVEAESFSVRGLERYQLDEQLLQARLNDQSLSDVGYRLQASGLLPHGHFGELSVEKRWRSLDPLVGRLEQLPALKVSRWPLRLVLTDDLSDRPEYPELRGWITSACETALVAFRPGKLRAKDRMLAWVDHLVAQLSSEIPNDSFLLGIDEAIQFSEMDPLLAQSHLQSWLDALKIASCQLFALPCEALWIYVDDAWDEASAQLSKDEGARQAAMNKAQHHYESDFGEINNRYIYQQLGDDLLSHWSQFDGWIQQLLVPIKQYQMEFANE